jgi:hypothetical protein
MNEKADKRDGRPRQSFNARRIFRRAQKKIPNHNVVREIKPIVAMG